MIWDNCCSEFVSLPLFDSEFHTVWTVKKYFGQQPLSLKLQQIFPFFSPCPPVSSVCLSQGREDETDGIVTFRALLAEAELAPWLELNDHISTELFC